MQSSQLPKCHIRFHMIEKNVFWLSSHKNDNFFRSVFMIKMKESFYTSNPCQIRLSKFSYHYVRSSVTRVDHNHKRDFDFSITKDFQFIRY